MEANGSVFFGWDVREAGGKSLVGVINTELTAWSSLENILAHVYVDASLFGFFISFFYCPFSLFYYSFD